MEQAGLELGDCERGVGREAQGQGVGADDVEDCGVVPVAEKAGETGHADLDGFSASWCGLINGRGCGGEGS